MKLTKWKMTLLAGLLSISGCSQVSQVTHSAKPVKPTLTAVTEVDGNVCFAKPDAVKLGLYILALERGYN